VVSEKIDEIDAKIITDLLKDARKSFSAIAKECKVSTTTISEHYDKLEKEGVIVGATVQMDYKTFGYDAVSDFLIKVDPQQINQVVEYIKKMPNIYGANPTSEPRYNVGMVATLRDLKELDQVKDAIRRHRAVQDFKTHIWIGIKNIPENLAISHLDKEESRINEAEAQTTKSEKAENKIDDTDIKIVENLAKNSREAFRKIAKEIGTSMDTVARRYKRLTVNGTIKSIIQIDPTKIGYNAMVTFRMTLAEHDSATIVDMLVKIPDLVLIIKTSGDYDISVFIMVKDLEQMLAMQRKVATIPGITRLETKVNEIRACWPGFKEYISTF
jgi:Lrp/AsnC family transcriptional regulator, regulator for asnA, asnC and gidA